MRVQGELRSGSRANMLMGVTSNRVDVKRRGARGRARAGAAGRAAGRTLPAADGVPRPPARAGLAGDGAQLRPRLHLRLLGRRRRRRRAAPLRRGPGHRRRPGRPGRQGLRPLAGRAGHRRCSTRRPGPASGVVELVVPADGPAPANVQVLSERSGLPGSMVLDANTVRTVLGMLQGPKISDDAWVHDIRIEDTDEGIDVTLSVGTEERPNVPIAEAKQDLYTRLGRTARRRGAGRHGPAVDAEDRRPHRRGARVRLGRLRGGPAGAPGRGERGRGFGRARQRAGAGGGRPGRAGPSRWTASPATGGSSTAATSATRTTTRRRSRTPRWRCPRR